MDMQVGKTIVTHHGVAKDTKRQHLATLPVAHFSTLGHKGNGSQGGLEAKAKEHASAIGTQLNASANLTEFTGLFKHINVKVLLCQRQGCDQPPYATANNKGWESVI